MTQQKERVPFIFKVVGVTVLSAVLPPVGVALGSALIGDELRKGFGDYKAKQAIKEVERFRRELEEQTRREQAQAKRLEEERQAALVRQENERQRIANLADLRTLQQLDPFVFEIEIAKMYRRLEYQVNQTPQSNDGGRDAIMRKDGKVYLLECKRYDGATVGRPELQKFMGAIYKDKADFGIFVTTGELTVGARTYLNGLPITLVEGNSLVSLMRESRKTDSL